MHPHYSPANVVPVCNHVLEARRERGRVYCVHELDGPVVGHERCSGKGSQRYYVEGEKNGQKSSVLDTATMSEPSRAIESGAGWRRPPELLCKRVGMLWHNHR